MNTKKFISMFLVTLVSMTLLIGCSQKESTQQSKTNVKNIEHELGTTAVPLNPKKIVVLEFSFVDALVNLGISPSGIADDNDANRIIDPVKKNMQEYTSVGTRKQPNLETISSLAPDLIIADVKRHSEIYDDLSKIAPTIEVKSLEGSYSDIINSFKIIASAVDKEDEEKKVLKNHDEMIENYKEIISKENSNQKVMTAVPVKDSFNVHTSSSFIGEVFSKVGITSAIESNEAYKELTLDQLVTINPDKIVLMRPIKGSIVEEWIKNPLWKELKAVKNNKVLEVKNTEAWSRFRGLVSTEIILNESSQILK